MGIESVMVGDDPDEEKVAGRDAVPFLDAAGEPAVPALPADFPANAAFLEDGTGVRLRLAYPKALKFKGPGGEIKTEEFHELELRRLTGKTFKAVREASQDMYRPQALAALTGMSLGRAKLLEEIMDVSDMSAVLAVLRFFITPGRRTGP